MIIFDEVSKSFPTRAGRRVILENCSLDFPTGYSVGILGRNGAGKSTLLRLLSGVDLPDSGRITRRGRVSFPLGFASTFREEVSGRGNVRFVARLYGEDERRVEEEVAEFAGLGSYFSMPVRTYSSGMKARLAFGLCLAIEFDVYLIDEVTAVGDADFRMRCRDAFNKRMASSDVIMVTHDLNTMREYCDLGAVLADGRLELFDDLRSAISAFQAMPNRELALLADD
jgi:capsular polysaccharide transport system ATP-binding protein